MKKESQDNKSFTAKTPAILYFGLFLLGGFLLVKALNYSYEQTDSGYPKAMPTFSIPTSTPIPSPVPTKKIINKTTETTNLNSNTNKPPLPKLNGGNIFGLVNQYRSSKGLPFLSVSSELCSIAEGRADLMMANKMEAFKKSGTGSHFGFDNVNYSGAGVGENLAANLARDVDVLTIWKNSPPHNELMLWTTKDGTPITKGCVATRVSEVGSIVVLLVGDK